MNVLSYVICRSNYNVSLLTDPVLNIGDQRQENVCINFVTRSHFGKTAVDLISLSVFGETTAFRNYGDAVILHKRYDEEYFECALNAAENLFVTK